MPTQRVRQPPRAPSAPAAPRPPSPASPQIQVSSPWQVDTTPQTGTNRNGHLYVVVPTTGGVFHQYENGRRVFVASRAPQAPTGPQPATPSAGSAAAVDPRDATYYAQSAQADFARNQKINQLTSEGSQDTQDHEEALRRLLENQPRAIQNAREQYNKMGLFYSGKLGEREGDLNTQYAQQRGDMDQSFERRQAARAAARAALEQGAPLDEAARLAEAADRQIDRDTATAAAGGLAAPESTPAASAPQRAAQGGTRGLLGLPQITVPKKHKFKVKTR